MLTDVVASSLRGQSPDISHPGRSETSGDTGEGWRRSQKRRRMEWNPERARILAEDRGVEPWALWGPYLSDRQWGTVREDYSRDGNAWDYFPFEQARSRAYRWGEDGILGISDRHQHLCFAPAFWNGADPILKERFFGLGGHQGNHGEDVKEQYYHLDNVPSHAYMRALYKYPQRIFPYRQVIDVNASRTRLDPEYELLDTGIFEDDAYFDVVVEYAKRTPTDILIRITALNRGPNTAPLHLVPQLWFRNEWSWTPDVERPSLGAGHEPSAILARHLGLGAYRLYYDGAAELLFTDNDTNAEAVFNPPNTQPYVKDGIDRAIVRGERSAVNPALQGTKAGIHYTLSIPRGGSQTIKLRLSAEPLSAPFGETFEATFGERIAEADHFYAALNPFPTSDEERAIQRTAFAGMLWSKQFYFYVVRDWLRGDPLQPPPPVERLHGRNSEWVHLYNDDVLSMPDTWEYPSYAAWDLAFHAVVFALIDPTFAKRQLIALTREWYMHPNGQLPASEWAFSDVNPPVHAWHASRALPTQHKVRGVADRGFLEKVFHKLLLNFTWWVNRKDPDGMNIFQGGFLGLDNIGIFDRSAPLPTGGNREQSDATSWMGMYCLNMLAIALELAKEDPAYEDVASKFFEHFVNIAHAMNDMGTDGKSLWDEADGFYYDVLELPSGEEHFMKIRSMVGLIPLFAVAP